MSFLYHVLFLFLITLAVSSIMLIRTSKNRMDVLYFLFLAASYIAKFKRYIINRWQDLKGRSMCRTKKFRHNRSGQNLSVLITPFFIMQMFFILANRQALFSPKRLSTESLNTLAKAKVLVNDACHIAGSMACQHAGISRHIPLVNYEIGTDFIPLRTVNKMTVITKSKVCVQLMNDTERFRHNTILNCLEHNDKIILVNAHAIYKNIVHNQRNGNG